MDTRTWIPAHAIDDGEGVGIKYKKTPILIVDGSFDANSLSDRFAAASAQLPREIVEFVEGKIRQHPNYVHRA